MEGHRLHVVLLFLACSILYSVGGAEQCSDGTCSASAATGFQPPPRQSGDDIDGSASAATDFQPPPRKCGDNIDDDWSLCPDSSVTAETTLATPCEHSFSKLPERREFFQRVQPPPNVDSEKFGRMLAKGGIHPRGVVLKSEFYELPFDINSTLLWEEARELLKTGGGWEKASKGNNAQGVVSKHFRITQTRGAAGELHGPFEEVDERLAKSPYMRTVLAALGGVIGNAALMKLPPGGEVGEHFDTSEYWRPRVRLHIPLKTNEKVIFSCGQLGESHDLYMKPGRVYLFDNHLGHKVINGGKSARIHLAVDMVGSRRFWDLVKHSRAIGSVHREATVPLEPVLEEDADSSPEVVIEAWRDAALQQHENMEQAMCQEIATAAADTAARVGLEEQAREVVESWCAQIQGKTRSRLEEVRLLKSLAASKACSLTGALSPPRELVLLDVLDSIAEVHRLGEADESLTFIGGESVDAPPPPGF